MTAERKRVQEISDYDSDNLKHLFRLVDELNHFALGISGFPFGLIGQSSMVGIPERCDDYRGVKY